MMFGSQLFGISQDIHFSQFFISPMAYNPAEAGNFQGDFRLSLNHKKQWIIIENSYTTSQATYDMPLLRRGDESTLGIGAVVYQDKAGISNFGQFNAGLSLAYLLPVNLRNSFRFGINESFGQRQIDLNAVSWDSQYSGAGYNPSLSSNENIASQNASWVDFSAGILWQRKLKGEEYREIGASALHINRPSVSFLGNKDPIETRFIIYGEDNYKMKEFFITPRFMVSVQGGHQEIMIGGCISKLLGISSRYTTFRTASKAWLGSYYRYNDAVAPFAGIRLKDTFSFGISYDIVTTSQLSRPLLNQGLEFSISISKFFKEERIKLK